MGRRTDHDMEDLAYTIAQKVVLEGKAASTVAKELFPDEYENSSTKSRAIMRVKTALNLARESGYLRLEPLKDESICKELEARYSNIEFDVVRDVGKYDRHLGSDVVYLAAAKAIAQEIASLLPLSGRLDEKKVIVGNCGGPSLSNTLAFLPPEVAVTESQAARLEFISMNAARDPAAYHLCANYLCVRLSDIYKGSSHRAMLSNRSSSQRQDSSDPQTLPDLLLCGVGTRYGLLASRYEECEGHTPPSEYVGDIALLPLDRYGNEHDLDSTKVSATVKSEWMAKPSYKQLCQIALKKRSLLVVASPRTTRDGKQPNVPIEQVFLSKAQVTHAVLEARLVKRCILGVSIASHLRTCANS